MMKQSIAAVLAQSLQFTDRTTQYQCLKLTDKDKKRLT